MTKFFRRVGPTIPILTSIFFSHIAEAIPAICSQRSSVYELRQPLSIEESFLGDLENLQLIDKEMQAEFIRIITQVEDEKEKEKLLSRMGYSLPLEKKCKAWVATRSMSLQQKFVLSKTVKSKAYIPKNSPLNFIFERSETINKKVQTACYINGAPPRGGAEFIKCLCKFKTEIDLAKTEITRALKKNNLETKRLERAKFLDANSIPALEFFALSTFYPRIPCKN